MSPSSHSLISSLFQHKKGISHDRRNNYERSHFVFQMVSKANFASNFGITTWQPPAIRMAHTRRDPSYMAQRGFMQIDVVLTVAHNGNFCKGLSDQRFMAYCYTLWPSSSPRCEAYQSNITWSRCRLYHCSSSHTPLDVINRYKVCSMADSEWVP